MKKNCVGIIGMGWVGSSIAISLLQHGIARELLLNDIRAGIAEGEAMDFNHGSSFLPAMNVRAASVTEMLDCDVIIVTAGRGGRPGESRLQLLNENKEIVRSLSAGLVGYQGVLLVVTNPVDVLTYFYQEYTGIPRHKVIGTGTFLDSARLRQMIGAKTGVEAKSVHADVIGEHGDSSVITWSSATIGGVALREWHNWNPVYEQMLRDDLRAAAQQIIVRKGSTNHAIGLVTAMLTKYILRDDRRVISVSTVLNNQFGLSDIALSLPCIISGDGVERIIEPKLSGVEYEELMHSARVVVEAIKGSS
jgi:L-lactate dehydrogenase